MPPTEGAAPKSATRADLDRPQYVAPPAPPIEWDPQRAETVLRGMGHLIHHLDPLGSSPHGAELWEMTEQDLREIAPPAARIANRYATVRGVAGYSDEAGVLLGAVPYVKRNLAERGRVRTLQERDRSMQEAEHRSLYQPERPVTEPLSEPESPPGGQPGSQPGSKPEARRVSEPEPEPVVLDASLPGPAGGENPKPPADFFEHWPEGTAAPLPFAVTRGD